MRFIAHVKDGKSILKVGYIGKSKKVVTEVVRMHFPDNAFRLEECRSTAKWKEYQKLKLFAEDVESLEEDEREGPVE